MSLMQIIIFSSGIMLALGIVFGIGLGYFAKVFKVQENPLIDEILEILPGANCGACGFSGCRSLAEGITSGKASIDTCRVGGEETVKNLAKLLGVSTDNISYEKYIAIPLCKGGKSLAMKNATVKGVKTCKIANNLKLNEKICTYGCLGYGDCVLVCPFNAIKMNDEGLPEIDPSLCTGCGLCVKECPREVIEIFPYKEKVLAICKNPEKGSAVRNACRVGCITCYVCEKKCPKNAIKMVNNLPVIDIEKCDLCGICINVCPTKTLSLIKALSAKENGKK
jgi:Na+-translocating ferredoxin:NAD+ oxidoreductase RNF subunit RnfB